MESTENQLTNSERYLFLDILKVIALILMPCIHVFNVFYGMELTGDLFPAESLSLQFGIIYLFVPGVFMFCMGAGIVLSKKQTPKELTLRGLKLLLVGFLLNVARGSIYVWFGVLGETECFLEYWYWFWGSDIMYFAGLYFLLFALVRKCKLSDIGLASISVVFLVISHLIMPVAVENLTLIQILGNFFYIDSDSCFPVLSWCVFPTAGYLFMKYLKSAEKKNQYVALVAETSAFVLIAFCAALLLTGNMESRYFLWGEEEFMMDMPSAVIAVSVALLYACGVYYLSLLIKPGRITSYITQISANVNTIYLIHWCIVMYMGFFLCVFADCSVNSGALMYLIGVLVFAVSTLLTFLYRKRKKQKKTV